MTLSRLFRCEADARSHTKKDLMVLIGTIKSFCRACHDEGNQSLSASLVLIGALLVALLFLFFDDVDGSFLGFKEDLGNVFSNDSHAKQLNSTDK